MYIWIGCALPKAFEHELRFSLREMNAEIGLNEVAFSLPQHISLKISFCVPDEQTEAVLARLEAELSKEKPFAVQLAGVEIMGNVLWLRAKPHARLKKLHTGLDALLEKEFAVPQHPLDKDFRFHSTVFMDDDAQKLRRMYDLMAQYPNNETLGISCFLLGTSESGKPGTYRVVRQIEL